jgi:hypothetical protein
MKIKKDGKEYINYLSNNLPKTVEERQIKDELQSQNQIDEAEFIIEEDDEIDFTEISGIPLFRFNRYKKHYIETGIYTTPVNFKRTPENWEKLKKYYFLNDI